MRGGAACPVAGGVALGLSEPGVGARALAPAQRVKRQGRREMRAQWAVVASLVASVAGAETLTVEDAVKRALELSPSLRALKERQEAAGDQSRSARGQMLPSVSVQDEYQHYKGPFRIAFGIPGAPAASPSFVAREHNTNAFVVAGRQPVLGLFRLAQDYRAADRLEHAAGAQVLAAERALTEQVQTGFLHLFEARASRQVAQTSQRQLEEQVVVAKARVAAGTLTSADVLRVEVAKANVEQQELQARVQESSARTLLLTLLDLPQDAAVEFAEPTSLEAAGAAPAPALAEASDRAFARRAELVQAAMQAESAEAQSRSRLLALLPEIDGEAAYVSVNGQVFAEKETYYIGVKASWPVWTWGAQYFAHRAAAHQATAARLLVDDSHRQVRVEVAGRVDQLEAATAAITVAKKALESAEEAFRVTTELVKAGAGTTTDLLDAQSALTQAKLNLVRSRYQQALARVQLERAMGG